MYLEKNDVMLRFPTKQHPVAVTFRKLDHQFLEAGVVDEGEDNCHGNFNWEHDDNL